MTKEEIGSVLKELRVQSGKTQKEIAEMIGRKQQIVGHWETGYSQPDANTLFTLCDIYGTSVDKAFGFVSNKSQNIFPSDLDLIKKYRALDTSGKETVNFIMDKEAQRMTILKEAQEALSILEKQVPLENTEPIPFQGRMLAYYHHLASAGTGQIVFDDIPTDSIQIPDLPKYKKVKYAIGVNGNSMEPDYKDGDILLVEPVREIEIGEIGIFMINRESYVKKLGDGELVSLNPDYDNIPIDDYCFCLGRVIDKLPPSHITV